MTNGTTIHIGTSGWHYEHWTGVFYPGNLHKPEWLRYYSEHLDSVEINNSFYRLPERKTFENWREQTPDNFVFAVKASRFITHIKKLRDSREMVPRFMERAEGLGKKLGITLFQLPPGWNFDGDRLEEFLEALPAGCRYVCEFRNASWLQDRTYDLLERHGVAFCIHDAGGNVTPFIITGGRAYIRLHGSTGMYQGSYSDDQLRVWADRIGEWSGRTEEIFFYFNNDWQGYAVHNAMRLQEFTGKRIPALTER
ncbi:MAG: DUF72 domain-containing protein [Candidatus Latescibacterota bacterium]